MTLTDRARERLSRRAQCDAVEAAFRRDHVDRVAALIAAGVDQEDARSEVLARAEGEQQR